MIWTEFPVNLNADCPMRLAEPMTPAGTLVRGIGTKGDRSRAGLVIDQRRGSGDRARC